MNEILLTDIELVKRHAPTAPIVLVCNCGHEQDVHNDYCEACLNDLR